MNKVHCPLFRGFHKEEGGREEGGREEEGRELELTLHFMTSDSESLRAISCVLISSDTIGSMNTQNDWREWCIVGRGERVKKQGIGSRLLFHPPNIA